MADKLALKYVSDISGVQARESKMHTSVVVGILATTKRGSSNLTKAARIIYNGDWWDISEATQRDKNNIAARYLGYSAKKYNADKYTKFKNLCHVKKIGRFVDIALGAIFIPALLFSLPSIVRGTGNFFKGIGRFFTKSVKNLKIKVKPVEAKAAPKPAATAKPTTTPAKPAAAKPAEVKTAQKPTEIKPAEAEMKTPKTEQVEIKPVEESFGKEYTATIGEGGGGAGASSSAGALSETQYLKNAKQVWLNEKAKLLEMSREVQALEAENAAKAGEVSHFKKGLIINKPWAELSPWRKTVGTFLVNLEFNKEVFLSSLRVFNPKYAALSMPLPLSLGGEALLKPIAVVSQTTRAAKAGITTAEVFRASEAASRTAAIAKASTGASTGAEIASNIGKTANWLTTLQNYSAGKGLLAGTFGINGILNEFHGGPSAGRELSSLEKNNLIRAQMQENEAKAAQEIHQTKPANQKTAEEQALEAARQAEEAVRKEIDNALQASALAGASGDYNKALNILNEALEKYPTSAKLYFEKALLERFHLDQKEQGIEDMKKAAQYSDEADHTTYETIVRVWTKELEEINSNQTEITSEAEVTKPAKPETQAAQEVDESASRLALANKVKREILGPYTTLPLMALPIYTPLVSLNEQIIAFLTNKPYLSKAKIKIVEDIIYDVLKESDKRLSEEELESKIYEQVAQRIKYDNRFTTKDATQLVRECYTKGVELEAEEYYRMAQNAADEGNYQKALEYYMEAIRLNPKNPRYYFYLGRLKSLYFEDYEGALAACMEAIRLDPKNPWYYFNIGCLKHFYLQDYEGALAAYTKAIKRADTNPLYYYYRSDLKKHYLGDLEGALEDIKIAFKYGNLYGNDLAKYESELKGIKARAAQRIHQDKPANQKTAQEQAQEAARQNKETNNFKNAISGLSDEIFGKKVSNKLFMALLFVPQTVWQFLSNEITSEQLLNRKEAIETAFYKAQKRVPQEIVNTNAKEALNQFLYYFEMELEYAGIKREKIEKLLNTARNAQAAQEVRQTKPANQKTAEEYYRMAQNAADEGNYQKALEYCMEAIKSDSKNPRYYISLGNVSSYLEDYEGALAAYTEVTKLDPKNSWYHFNLGYLKYMYSEDYEGALAAYMEAIRLDSKNPWFYFYLGCLKHFYLQDYEGALAAYTEAIKRDDTNPFFYYYRSDLKRDHFDDLEGTIDDLTMATKYGNLYGDTLAKYENELNAQKTRAAQRRHQGKSAKPETQAAKHAGQPTTQTLPEKKASKAKFDSDQSEYKNVSYNYDPGEKEFGAPEWGLIIFSSIAIPVVILAILWALLG